MSPCSSSPSLVRSCCHERVYLSFGVAVAAIAPMLTEVRRDLDVSRERWDWPRGVGDDLHCDLRLPVVDRFDLGWSLALGGVSITGSLLLRAGAQNLAACGWLLPSSESSAPSCQHPHRS